MGFGIKFPTKIFDLAKRIKDTSIFIDDYTGFWYIKIIEELGKLEIILIYGI